MVKGLLGRIVAGRLGQFLVAGGLAAGGVGGGVAVVNSRDSDPYHIEEGLGAQEQERQMLRVYERLASDLQAQAEALAAGGQRGSPEAVQVAELADLLEESMWANRLLPQVPPSGIDEQSRREIEAARRAAHQEAQETRQSLERLAQSLGTGNSSQSVRDFRESASGLRETFGRLRDLTGAATAYGEQAVGAANWTWIEDSAGRTQLVSDTFATRYSLHIKSELEGIHRALGLVTDRQAIVYAGTALDVRHMSYDQFARRFTLGALNVVQFSDDQGLSVNERIHPFHEDSLHRLYDCMRSRGQLASFGVDHGDRGRGAIVRIQCTSNDQRGSMLFYVVVGRDSNRRYSISGIRLMAPFEGDGFWDRPGEPLSLTPGNDTAAVSGLRTTGTAQGLFGGGANNSLGTVNDLEGHGLVDPALGAGSQRGSQGQDSYFPSGDRGVIIYNGTANPGREQSSAGQPVPQGR